MLPVPAAVAPAAADDSQRAALTAIEQVYRQWLDTAQQIYRLPAIPAPSKGEAKTAVGAR
jgi:hypothetical protein